MMPEWNWECTETRPTPIEYKNVVGTAFDVEAQVNKLIKDGWHLNGSLLPLVSDRRNTGMLIQSMVKYARTK